MSVCYHSKELYNLIVKNKYKTMRNTVRQETTHCDWSLFTKTYCDWLSLYTCHRPTNQVCDAQRYEKLNPYCVYKNRFYFFKTRVTFLMKKNPAHQ